MTSSNSACRSSTSSAKRSSTLDRSMTGTRAQSRCARRAAWAAAARSSDVLCGTTPRTSPVAGISTGIGSTRPVAATRPASLSKKSWLNRGPSLFASGRAGLLLTESHRSISWPLRPLALEAKVPNGGEARGRWTGSPGRGPVMGRASEVSVRTLFGCERHLRRGALSS